jgi:hypothetical protein
MLMRIAKLSVLAVAVLLASVALPAFAASNNDATVATFVQGMARSMNLNATDARIAADSLRAVGVRLPADLELNKRLTEADVVQISQAAGLPVNTSNPEAFFTGDQVDRFFDVFGSELTSVGNENADQTPRVAWFDPFYKGKGKKVGWLKKGYRTPTEPE